MLSFEEFSAKKRIDLSQFSAAEPILYAEFKSEYQQMGEKSFDHSKKFLFNKIRRAYHLKVEPKATKVQIEKSAIAPQTELLEYPTSEQKHSYTPTFKPKTLANQAIESPSIETPDEDYLSSDMGSTLPEEKPRPAYQPRFNMQTAPVKQNNNLGESIPADNIEEISEKPATYKPKFNMKAIVAKSEIEKEEEQSKDESPQQPNNPAAYKPRFNIKNIKQNKD